MVALYRDMAVQEEMNPMRINSTVLWPMGTCVSCKPAPSAWHTECHELLALWFFICILLVTIPQLPFGQQGSL